MDAAKEKYEKKLMKVLLRLNPDVVQDLIELLKGTDNKQGLIKIALREYIKKRGSNYATSILPVPMLIGFSLFNFLV